MEVYGLLIAWQFPGDQVLLSIVLGGLSIPCLGAQVDDLDNLVDKDNYLILQALCSVRKLSDPADGVDYFHLLSRHGKVHSNVSLCELPSNDLSTKFTKASLEQGANPKDGLLEHTGFHLGRVSILNWDLWLFQRILSQFLDDRHDFLDWNDHSDLCVP